jgi:hypothetical protein
MRPDDAPVDQGEDSSAIAEWVRFSLQASRQRVGLTVVNAADNNRRQRRHRS